MLLKEHLQAAVFVWGPWILSLQRERLKVLFALLRHPFRLLAQRQRLQLGEVDEASVLLRPRPELIQINYPPRAFVNSLGVHRQPTVPHPALHLVAVRLRIAGDCDHQLIESNVVPGIQPPAEAQSFSPNLDRRYCPLQRLGDARNGYRAPMVFQIPFFFRRPCPFGGAA